MPDSAFAEFRVSRRTPSRDYNGSQTFAEEIVRVIQTRPKHRRWTPIVLRGAEDDNRVCGMKLLFPCVTENN